MVTPSHYAVEKFVTTIKEKITRYIHGKRVEDASKSDLADFNKTVAAIANDPDGKASIQAAYFEDGQRKIREAFVFNTPEARTAEKEIAQHRLELEKKTADIRLSEADLDEGIIRLFFGHAGDLLSAKRLGPCREKKVLCHVLRCVNFAADMPLMSRMCNILMTIKWDKRSKYGFICPRLRTEPPNAYCVPRWSGAT